MIPIIIDMLHHHMLWTFVSLLGFY